MGTDAFHQTERLRWDVTKNIGLLTNNKGAPASPDPVLELACFAKPPRICFENVKLGSTKVKVLKIFNPGEEIESIVLEKFPDPELGFSIEGLHSAQQLHLQPKEEVEIKISWQPINPGNSRHLVTFRWIGGQKLQLVILASAQDPNAGKKKRARRIPAKRALYPSQRLNVPQEKLQAVKKSDLMTHGQKARGYEGSNVKKLVDVAPDTPSRRSTFTVAQSTFEKKDVGEVNCDEKENVSVLSDDNINRATFSVENVANDVAVKDAQNAVTTTGHEDEKLDPKMATFEGKIIGENPDYDQSVEGNTFHESEIRLSSSPIKWCVGYEHFTSSTYKRELHPGQVVLNGEVKHGFMPYPSFDNTDSFLHMEMSTTGKHKVVLEEESLSFDSAASSLFTITREEKFYPNLEPVKESTDALATPKAFSMDSKTLTNETDTATPLPSQNGTWINEVREGSDYSYSIAREEKFVPNLEPLKETSYIVETPKASQSRTLTNETCGATPLPVDQCTWEGEVKSLLDEDAVSQRFSDKADDIASKDEGRCSANNKSKYDIASTACRVNSTVSRGIAPSPNESLEIETQTDRCRTSSRSAASLIHTKQFKQELNSNARAMPANEHTIVGQQAVHIELIDGKQFEGVSASERHDLVDSVLEKSAKDSSAVVRNTPKSKLSMLKSNSLKQSEYIKKTEGSRTVQSRYMISKSKCKDLPVVKQNKESIKMQPRKNTNVVDAKFKGIHLPQKRRNETVLSAGKTVKPSVAIKKLKLVKPQEKIARHPMPYAAKNMFYDERWIEKQERGFKNWLNFVLTPPDDDVETRNDTKRGTVCLETESNQPVAPTKEMLSFKMYAAKRRMAKLRRDACMLYQTDQFASVIHKIEREIEHGRLAIRVDRHVDADLGVRKHIADMLLSFNPLWLRIGLEIVYGEIIPMNSNNDAFGLSRFIHRRLLGNPDIAAEYSHPSVPGLYKPGYVEAIGKFTLKKLLLVIIYLDKAKNSRLISHDPCLFNKDSQFKSIREMLLMFSRDYLHREGDIVKHLTYLGYTISHVQTPLQEYDFGVSSLAVDLRDGLRLVRVVELLTQNWSLSPRLRVPAVSRLQKIHNMELAFQGLTERGLDVKKESHIDARFIVDGHREKTLSLLWKIIFHFQVDLLLNEGKLKDEIKYLERKITLMNDYGEFRQNVALKTTDDDLFENGPYNKCEKLGLLLRWCYLVGKLHGVRVENFTVSFSDGRALCYLLNHYHPYLLTKEEIRDETTITCHASQGDSEDEADEFLMCQNSKSNSYYSRTGANVMLDALLANEKHNLSVFCEKVKEVGASPAMVLASDMSNTIPDEKVVIAYLSFLCSRLLDLREEIRAARCIQMAWRQHHLQDRKKEQQLLFKAATKIQAIARGFMVRRRLQKKTEAVKLLQKNVRSFLTRKRQYERECAATLIQQHYKALKQMRLARKSYLEKRTAAVKIQRAYRRTLQIRNDEQQKAACCIQVAWKNYQMHKLRSKENKAVLIVQRNWRGYVNRKRFLLVRNAALILQRAFRAYLKKSWAREEFLNKRRAAVTLQSYWRQAIVRRETAKVQACVVIQASFRRYRCRTAYLELKGAVIKIQSNVRKLQCQSRYNKLKRTIVHLQCTRRSLVTTRNARDEFQRAKVACITIQKIYRGRIAQREFRRMKVSAIKVQAAWRGKVCRQQLVLMQLAASRIQNAFRAWKVMCAARKEFTKLRDRTITIQTAFRKRRQRMKFLAIRNAAIKVQTLLRGKVCRDRFLSLKAASVTIQRQYRAAALGRTTRIEYQQIRESSMKIQAWYRGRKSRKVFVDMKRAAICLQSSYRRHVAVRRFEQVKNAALVIQQRYRAVKLCQATQVHFLITKAAVIKIQSLYKGYVCRKDFNKRRSAAVLIQATYRGHVVRKRACSKIAAATKIQSLWRCYLQQREYKVLKEATVVIQRNARRYIELRKYQSIRRAVIKIQRFYRGYLQMKATVYKYQQERSAIIKIQAVSRGFLCRRMLKKHRAAQTLQAATRGYLQRKRYLELVSAVLKIQAIARSNIECRRRKDAATCIQRQWKAFLYGRAEHARYLKTKQACITIQSFIRRWIKLRCFAKLRSATLVIQRRFRAQCLMQEKQSEYKRMKNSVIVIQSVYRMHLASKQFSDKKKAVILLQRRVRILIAQRRFRREMHAAKAIQHWYKACKEMQERRSSFLKTKKAVLLLQAQQRGLVLRRRFTLMKNAAVKIQAWYRMVKAKRSYIEKRNAILTIQGRYRAFVACQMQQVCFHLMRGAAITIQACVRGFLARRSFIRVRRAAVCLQASWRRYICERRYRSLQKSVVNLQRKVRANALARVEKRDFMQKRTAAVRIQRKLREFLVLKKAAIMIQAQFRMLCDRRRFIMMRRSCIMIQRCFRTYVKRRSAAIVVQSFWRMHVARKAYRGKISACITLQSAVKGFIVKRRYMVCLGAVLVIQRRYRAYVEGSSVRREFVDTRRSCVLLQACLRGWSARKTFVNLRQKAIVLQRRYKAQVAMKNQRHNFIELKSAAVKIQGAYRVYLAKLLAENKREQKRIEEALKRAREEQILLERHRAATVIQKHFKGSKRRSDYLELKENALKIQRFYRNHLLTLRTRNEYLVQYRSVVIIQRAYRMYIARKHLQMLRRRKEKLNTAAICIQSMFRCLIERKLFLKKKDAANTIQRYFKGHLLAKRIRRQYLLQRSSAVKIQSAYRSYAAKSLLRSLQQKRNVELQAAILIQKTTRGFLCRRYYKRLQSAVVVIQRAYRSTRIMMSFRDQYIETRNAALKIQRSWRSYLVKKAITRRIAERKRRAASALMIQKSFRYYKFISSLRAELCLRRAAAIKIQRCFRGYVAKKQMLKFRAALKIQYAYRRYKEEQNSIREISATKIQASFRGYIQRRYYRKLKAVAIILQSKVRESLQKRRSVRQNAAAIVIQRWYRSVSLMRRDMVTYKEKRRAALCIQSIWRGYLVRRGIVDRRTIRARERIESANQDATEPKKLCNRTQSALSYLLNCKNVSTIYEALKDLEVSTRLSAKCCERLVQDNALPVIFQIIRNCNRSLPSIEQIHMALLVLANIAKCPTTYMAIVREDDSLQLVIELMANFREKRKIFPNCCILLSILCNDYAIVQLIHENSILLKKLKALNSLIYRKAQIELKRTNGKVRQRKDEKKDPLSIIEQLTSISDLVNIINPS